MDRLRQWTIEDLAFGTLAVIAVCYLVSPLFVHKTVSENMVCFEDIKND